jgi:TatD DNase family protein
MVNYLYDTHFHLDLVENMADAIKEIEQNKVYTIAVTNLPVLYTKLESHLSSKFIKPALGFHPELLLQYKTQIPQMWKLLTETRYIGEVGLDFKTGNEFKELQTSFFEELISRCDVLGNKILTVHSRRSAKEVVSIIGKGFKGKAILHWYSGSITTLTQAINNGYYFSINHSMTTNNSGKEIIKTIPIEQILLETDAPFTLIQNKPFKTKDLKYTIKELSIILDKTEEEMSMTLWNNFKKLLQ